MITKSKLRIIASILWMLFLDPTIVGGILVNIWIYLTIKVIKEIIKF